MMAGGNHIWDQLAEKVGQQEQIISVLSVACCLCSGTEDSLSKFVEAVLTSGVSVVKSTL